MIELRVERGVESLSLWETVKGFVGLGNPAAKAARNFSPKRSPANAILLFGIVALASIVAIGAFGGDKPQAVTAIWMVFILAIFYALGSWIYGERNPHDPLAGKALSDFLQAKMTLGMKDGNVLDLTATEVPRGPDTNEPKGIALDNDNAGGEVK